MALHEDEKTPEGPQSAPSMEQHRPLAAPTTGIPRNAQPGSTYSHSWTPNCWGHSKGPGHKQARLPQDDVGTAQDRA